jgi:hypothetical protein
MIYIRDMSKRIFKSYWPCGLLSFRLGLVSFHPAPTGSINATKQQKHTHKFDFWVSAAPSPTTSPWLLELEGIHKIIEFL